MSKYTFEVQYPDESFDPDLPTTVTVEVGLRDTPAEALRDWYQDNIDECSAEVMESPKEPEHYFVTLDRENKPKCSFETKVRSKY